MQYARENDPWDCPKPPKRNESTEELRTRMAAVTTREINFDDFVSVWGAYIHAEGRLFTQEEVSSIDYCRVWTVTDREAAHAGVAAVPGEFGDAYYGYCVTDKPWGWDFYQAGGYAVVTAAGDAADDRFADHDVIPLPARKGRS